MTQKERKTQGFLNQIQQPRTEDNQPQRGRGGRGRGLYSRPVFSSSSCRINFARKLAEMGKSRSKYLGGIRSTNRLQTIVRTPSSSFQRTVVFSAPKLSTEKTIAKTGVNIPGKQTGGRTSTIQVDCILQQNIFSSEGRQCLETNNRPICVEQVSQSTQISQNRQNQYDWQFNPRTG